MRISGVHDGTGAVERLGRRQGQGGSGGGGGQIQWTPCARGGCRRGEPLCPGGVTGGSGAVVVVVVVLVLVVLILPAIEPSVLAQIRAPWHHLWTHTTGHDIMSSRSAGTDCRINGDYGGGGQ